MYVVNTTSPFFKMVALVQIQKKGFSALIGSMQDQCKNIDDAIVSMLHYIIIITYYLIFFFQVTKMLKKIIKEEMY